MEERCLSEDLPKDFLDRLAYDVSVETFCKWLIEKAAEKRGRFKEHVPLRAVGFMLSIGTYMSYMHIYIFNVFLSITFTYWWNFRLFLGSYTEGQPAFRHSWAGILLLSATSTEVRHGRLIFFEPASKNGYWQPNWGAGNARRELTVPPVVGEVKWHSISRWIKEQNHMCFKLLNIYISDDEDPANRASGFCDRHSRGRPGKPGKRRAVPLGLFVVSGNKPRMWGLSHEGGRRCNLQGLFCENIVSAPTPPPN